MSLECPWDVGSLSGSPPRLFNAFNLPALPELPEAGLDISASENLGQRAESLRKSTQYLEIESAELTFFTHLDRVVIAPERKESISGHEDMSGNSTALNSVIFSRLMII